jgi:hypothetical protein
MGMGYSVGTGPPHTNVLNESGADPAVMGRWFDYRSSSILSEVEGSR